MATDQRGLFCRFINRLESILVTEQFSFFYGSAVHRGCFAINRVVPPMPLFLKHQTPQFEVVSQLDRELDELISQKQQLGLTLEKLAELEQKIEQANARLARYTAAQQSP